MACEEAVSLLNNYSGDCEIQVIDPPEFEKQVEVLTQLAYYELSGGKDGNIEVPMLVIDEYDEFQSAQKFIGQDVINKLKEVRL